ncbi:MAG: carotenoid oxygenase family protein [Parachlamydiaceae bacterium]|nr:carotenoid oxygenase family protein [Parachlamydiaceae bacterium]
MRYHLSLNNHEILPEILLEKNVEFPRLDDKLDGKYYQYLYMTISEDSTNNFLKEKKTGLGKFDLVTKQLKTWFQNDCTAVEPIFISSPTSKDEDEGVILTVIYEEVNKRSYLLALDGQSFFEIARAELPWHIPGSFHGQYFYENVFYPLELKKELL